MSAAPRAAQIETSAAARIGVPVEEYRSQRQAGKRWCAWHGRFESELLFASNWRRVLSSCPDGHREASRQAMARMRERRAVSA